jgi:hypothetical protein
MLGKGEMLKKNQNALATLHSSSHQAEPEQKSYSA